MSGQLMSHGDGGDARCVGCGAIAVGPCARCRSPVCGDCCVLTTGSANVWAICLSCDRRGGRSLQAGWRHVILWFLMPAAALLALLALLYLLFGGAG